MSAPSKIRARTLSTRLAVLVCALLAVVAGTAGPARASDGCWKELVNDYWTDGRVDRVYPTSCYRDAIANLPPDVQQYSDAEEDLRTALSAAVRDRYEDDGGSSPSDQREAAAAAPVDEEASRGFVEEAIDRAGSKNSIPVPIVVLAAIALMLLGSAGFSRFHG